MQLKHCLVQGMSKAELSRRFGIIRRTIQRWFATGQLDRDLAAGARLPAARKQRSQNLDPYKPMIDARLEAIPKLSAQRQFDEVRSSGNPGGYGRVRDRANRSGHRSLRSLCPARSAEKHLGRITPKLGPPLLEKCAILL